MTGEDGIGGGSNLHWQARRSVFGRPSAVGRHASMGGRRGARDGGRRLPVRAALRGRSSGCEFRRRLAPIEEEGKEGEEGIDGPLVTGSGCRFKVGWASEQEGEEGEERADSPPVTGSGWFKVTKAAARDQLVLQHLSAAFISAAAGRAQAFRLPRLPQVRSSRLQTPRPGAADAVCGGPGGDLDVGYDSNDSNDNDLNEACDKILRDNTLLCEGVSPPACWDASLEEETAARPGRLPLPGEA